MATFLLLHGAFHGAWCWARTAPLLRARGHTVFTPTQTGLGDRSHLLSPAITLDTFVQDVCATLETEELDDAILVGHSFGGLGITGAADRMPHRIRHLVYLDSRILEPGQSMLDADPVRAAEWVRLANANGGGIPVPSAGYFGLDRPEDVAWVQRRMTPQPVNTFTTPLTLAEPRIGNGLPCTYVACTRPAYAPLEPTRHWARNRPGWSWADLPTGHDAMVSDPAALATLLDQVAAPA